MKANEVQHAVSQVAADWVIEDEPEKRLERSEAQKLKHPLGGDENEQKLFCIDIWIKTYTVMYIMMGLAKLPPARV